MGGFDPSRSQVYLIDDSPSEALPELLLVFQGVLVLHLPFALNRQAAVVPEPQRRPSLRVKLAPKARPQGVPLIL